MESRMESRTPISLEHLLAGDLLLFRPSIQTWFMQQVIMYTQALFHSKHGHYDTTHVAICVGHNERNHPKIAHVTEKHEQMGYIEEDLEEMFKRDDGDRPFLIFRPRNRRVAAQIADIAGHHENHQKNLKWKLYNGIKSLFNKHNVDPKEEAPVLRSLSKSTICSQFAIESIKIAAKDQYPESEDQHEYPTLHSTSSPKALEGYLYRSSSYRKLCYLGKDAFKNLSDEVQKQITRIGQCNDTKSYVKCADATVEFQDALEEINKHIEWDEMKKSLFLMDRVLPVFKRSTGLGLFNTTSYSAIVASARKIGIFERDIREFKL